MGICTELHSCVAPGWPLDRTHLISFSARCLLSSSSSFPEEKAEVQKGDRCSVTQLLRRSWDSNPNLSLLVCLDAQSYAFSLLPITWGPWLSHLTSLPLTFTICEVDRHAVQAYFEMHTRRIKKLQNIKNCGILAYSHFTYLCIIFLCIYLFH